MASKDPRTRQIKINTGVVKRLTKEKSMYEKEVGQEERRLEKMKAEGKDEHDINKQSEVIQESKMMVPDCRMRLEKACGALQTMLDAESDLNEAEEYQAAQLALEEAKPALK